MSTNPLDPAFDAGGDRSVKRGHGTRALGPSDSSDSGSDVLGGGAGQRLGDAELDGDSDRSGTGERVSATPDTELPEGSDIAPDRIERGPEEDEDEGD